ncbi:MAG: alpha/beta fold hydrolase [Pseudomonadota bacterium]
MNRRLSWALLSALMVLVIVLSLWGLNTRYTGLNVEEAIIGSTPVTYYRGDATAPRYPVIVTHGFGGSRQMMEQISVSLARQGFFVAALDFPGHGRNTVPLSPDISRIEGTTAQLVETVQTVSDAVLAHPDTMERISLLGHSMATDVIIRAASEREDVDALVAISMYSTAVTDRAPQSLLILSGANERALRRVALEAVQQVEANAGEGQTAQSDGTERRSAVVPWVGHVGVLYAKTTFSEISDWLRVRTGAGQMAQPDQSVWRAGRLLVALTLLVWPLAQLLPRRAAADGAPVPAGVFWLCLAVPLPVSLIPALAPVFGVAGYASFGTLAACLGLWGTAQIVILYMNGFRIPRPDLTGTLAYLVWAGVFALVLDRYGAAFLPAGARGWVMLGLMIGTLPLMMADARLMQAAPVWRRIVARIGLLVALSSAIALAPRDLGLAFTVLPVLVLFFLVYGTVARWVAARRGPEGVMIGTAAALAWAIAASTPLFAAGGAP